MAIEAEEKEKAAKAARKARLEHEARVQSQESSTSPVVSVAESTTHEAVDVAGLCTIILYIVLSPIFLCIPLAMLRWQA